VTLAGRCQGPAPFSVPTAASVLQCGGSAPGCAAGGPHLLSPTHRCEHKRHVSHKSGTCKTCNTCKPQIAGRQCGERAPGCASRRRGDSCCHPNPPTAGVIQTRPIADAIQSQPTRNHICSPLLPSWVQMPQSVQQV